MRSSPRLARLALLALAVSAAGCGSKAPAITGLTVTVTMDMVMADQLQFEVTSNGAPVFQSKLRPETPNGNLKSPQSVSIYLPDELQGVAVTCTVTPFLNGVAGSAGSNDATLILHRLVPVMIGLEAGDGGAAGAGAGGSGGGGGNGGAAGVDGGTPGGGGSGGAGGSGGGGNGGSGGSLDAGTDGPKALGQPCQAGGECDSTLCVDGVCCASACGTLCQTCNLPGKEGTCTPVASGTAPSAAAAQKCAVQPATSCGFDGTCDGNGGCRKYPAGAQCKAPSCNGASYLPASACDGQGACVAAKAVDCTPYKCSTAGAAPACLMTCAMGGTDCVSPAVCNNSSCGARPKQANGAGCVADTDCTSSHCADGVCCMSACAGACTACDLPGMEGMCLNVDAGKADPHKVCKDGGAATCMRNGLCDGAGACALYPTTTTCLAGSCKNATLHPARHCDGKGACVVPNDVDCTPWRCDPSTTACFTSCQIAVLQCAPRKTCTNMTCM